MGSSASSTRLPKLTLHLSEDLRFPHPQNVWLSCEDARALVGSRWDQALWDATPKNDKDQVTLAQVQALAQQRAGAASSCASDGGANGGGSGVVERFPHHHRSRPHSLAQWLGDVKAPKLPPCHSPIDFYPVSTLAPTFEAAPATVSMEAMSDTWGWDVLGLKSTNEVMEAVHFIFMHEDFCTTLQVTEAQLSEFESAIGMLMLPNFYHNLWHAADVLFMTWRMLHDTGTTEWMSKLDTVAALVAAFAHDTGHPALNNNFLVATRSDIALRHNDSSPLENMHCAILYDVLKCDETALFANLSNEDHSFLRTRVIQAILGTDMTNHFRQLSRVTDIHAKHGTNPAAALDEAERIFTIEMFVHAADISNPAKTTEASMRWSYLVTEEFFAQSDLERDLGLAVTPMLDRNTVNIASSQIGFIEFMVFPMFLAMNKIFPNLHQANKNMIENTKAWGEVRAAELQAQEDRAEATVDEISKLEARRTLLVEKHAKVEALWSAEAVDAAAEPAENGASKEAAGSTSPAARVDDPTAGS